MRDTASAGLHIAPGRRACPRRLPRKLSAVFYIGARQPSIYYVIITRTALISRLWPETSRRASSASAIVENHTACSVVFGTRNESDRPDEDEIQTLSRISERYSNGALCQVVKRTLTARRIERLARKPFQVSELLGPLAKDEPLELEIDKSLREWYQETVPMCAAAALSADGRGGG